MGQWGMVRVARGKFKRAIVRVYAATTHDRTEYRFHIYQLDDLLQHLSNYGIAKEKIEFIEHEIYIPVSIELESIDDREPRPKQIPLIEYNVAPGKSKLTTLQTGGGKSLIATNAFKQIGQRVCTIIKPMYIEKWIEDFRKVYNITVEDLMVVQGSAQLKALFKLALSGELTSKIIIISNATYREYIKAYEQFKENMLPDYGVLPDNAMEALGIGVRFIDEVHQDYHFNFRLDLYTHVPKTISLSATMESDDSFMNRIYRINWPHELRAPAVEYDKYIVMSCLWYNIDQRMVHKLRHTGANKNYSHVEFEKSIMRQPVFLKKYIDMLVKIVLTSYGATWEPGHRMLIFCSTINMCTLLTEELKKHFPTLSVKRYTESDSYDEFIESDIAVSTLQSAGTAIDKPNLSKVLMTTALSGKQANEQAVGRLRRMRDFPNVTPEFIYLACRQIPKHVMYAHSKEAKLNGKVLSFKEYQTSFYL